MPKGYWIAHVTVTAPDHYPDYVTAAQPAFDKYGANFLARGGTFHCVEGHTGDRHVIIEFESMERALACYNSPEYQEAVAIRHAAAVSTMTIVEGVE